MTENRPSTSRASGGWKRFAGRLLAGYTRLVHATSSLSIDPPDSFRVGREEGPFIFAMWHGQFLMIPVLQIDGPTADVMVARHGDGEIIAEVLRSYGSQLIRGAGAGGRRKDRGGAAALRAAIKRLDEGVCVSMTADVPPGPARRAGEGIVTLARLSGRPIRAVAIASSHYVSLDTWSRMTINLPFSKLRAVLGPPITVPRDATPEQLEAARRAVETTLDAATERAYQLAGADPARATPPAILTARRGPPPPGARYAVYRALTRALTPALGLVLGWRLRQGKEDPARWPERKGIAGLTRPSGTLAWFHAASVGETNAILPVIAELKARRPDIGVLLTTGTVTSARIAQARAGAGVIHQYVPLDAPAYVTRFLDHWAPDVGILTEGDIWPNLLVSAVARKVRMVLVNARMSPRSYQRWRRNRTMARPLFGRFSLVLAQNDKLQRWFTDLGAPDVRVSGNLKLDAPAQPVDAAALAQLSTAIAGRPVWIAASTHAGEEEIAVAVHRRLADQFPGLLTIIAPRHPQRGREIADGITAQGLGVAMRATGALPTPQTAVYVADTLGELGTLYTAAPIAFVGGSLVTHGGQNPIEAVQAGAAVVSGPHTSNFADIYAALERAGGALRVDEPQSLADAIASLLADPAKAEASRQQARRVVDGLSGSLAMTVDAIIGLLPRGH